VSLLECVAPEQFAELRTVAAAAITPLVQAVRGEYLEIPQLLLTRAQVQSCWDLDDDQCDEVLDSLLGCGFLRVASNGGFVRN
jgi:hypothetical protein